MKIEDDGHLCLHCRDVQGWPGDRELPPAGAKEVSSTIFTYNSRIAAAYARACGHRVTFAAPGILAEVLDDDPAYRLIKQKEHTDVKTYMLSVHVQMKEIGWSDTKAGQQVYYLTKQQKRKPLHSNVEPHGPFTVVDPIKGILRNGQGVEIPFINTDITLLTVTNYERD